MRLDTTDSLTNCQLEATASECMMILTCGAKGARIVGDGRIRAPTRAEYALLPRHFRSRAGAHGETRRFAPNPKTSGSAHLSRRVFFGFAGPAAPSRRALIGPGEIGAPAGLKGRAMAAGAGARVFPNAGVARIRSRLN